MNDGMVSDIIVLYLQILREVGLKDYEDGLCLMPGAKCEEFLLAQHRIQKNYVGPDCFWKADAPPGLPAMTSYFGTSWWIPFPPTLV